MAIGMIILPLFIPVEILDAFYRYYFVNENSDLSVQLAPTLWGFLVYPVYTGGTIFYIASAVDGKIIDVQTAWRLGAKFWMPFVLLSVLVGLVTMAGFLLLIIPGIILVARYSFAPFELLLNNKSPLDAMRDSMAGTKKYMWTILGGYLFLAIIIDSSYYLLGAFFRELAIPGNMLNILYSVLGVMYTIFTFRVYHLAKEQGEKGLEVSRVE